MTDNLVIVGCGDLGVLVAKNAALAGYDVIGFYDDINTQRIPVAGYPVLGTTDHIMKDFEKGLFSHLYIAIGYKHMAVRHDFYLRYKGKIPMATIIHPSAVRGIDTVVGENCLLLPGVVIDNGAVIADNVVLNTGVVIAHDTTIMSSTFIGPGATLAGFISIGERCFIGIGAVIKDNIKVVADSVVGAGAVVVKDIQEQGTYIGVPAKMLVKG